MMKLFREVPYFMIDRQLPDDCTATKAIRVAGQ